MTAGGLWPGVAQGNTKNPPKVGNIKPDKEKSSQKIDGIVAAIMALGEWLTDQAKNEANPYNDRGMLTL